MAHQKRLKDIRAEAELKAVTLKAGLPWPPPGYKSPVGKPPRGGGGVHLSGGGGDKGLSHERADSAAPDGGGTPEPAMNGANDGATQTVVVRVLIDNLRVFSIGCSSLTALV